SLWNHVQFIEPASTPPRMSILPPNPACTTCSRSEILPSVAQLVARQRGAPCFSIHSSCNSSLADADLQAGRYGKGSQSDGQGRQAGQPKQVPHRRQALQGGLQCTAAQDQNGDVQRQDQQSQQQTAPLESHRERRAHGTQQAQYRRAQQQRNQ